MLARRARFPPAVIRLELLRRTAERVELDAHWVVDRLPPELPSPRPRRLAISAPSMPCSMLPYPWKRGCDVLTAGIHGASHREASDVGGRHVERA
jgi:hypothetical protein